MPFAFNTISEVEILRSPGGRNMIDTINYSGPKNLILTGCPGSGKTTVAIMRALKLRREGKNILLVTYQNLLRVNLASMAGDMMDDRIVGFYEWFVKTADQRIEWKDTTATLLKKIETLKPFDEILLDEGQDLEKKFLEVLIGKTQKISIGADTAQKIHDHGQTAEQIIKVLNTGAEPHRVNLNYNYRNNFETYDFGRHFLPLNQRANNKLTLDKITKGITTKPVIFQALTTEEEKNVMRTRLIEAGDVNIAVLVYHIKEVEEYHKMITELGFDCSKYYHEMDWRDKKDTLKDLQNIIVTTFKSAKGLEFQVVVMPNIQTAMDESFKTREHYYVGCTRAKEQLYLIFNGDKPVFLGEFPDDTYTFVPGTGDGPDDDDLPF
jgi:superfamily I DNA/RNA helicase